MGLKRISEFHRKVLEARVSKFWQNKLFVRQEKGLHSTMDSVFALHPVAQGSILGIPEDLFLTEIYSLHVAEIH